MADHLSDWSDYARRAPFTRGSNRRMVLRTRMLKFNSNVSHAFFHAYSGWASDLLKQHQLQKANQKFKRAMQVCQDPRHEYDNWLSALYSKREFEEAILFAEEYLDKFQSQENMHNTLANCFLHLGDYENAIKCFQNVAQKGKVRTYYFDWALALYLQGKIEEAFDTYRKADQMGEGVRFPEARYEREIYDLKEDLYREENKISNSLIKKQIEAIEYFLERYRRKKRRS